MIRRSTLGSVRNTRSATVRAHQDQHHRGDHRDGRGNAWYGDERVVTLTVTVIVLLTLPDRVRGTVSAATSASPSPDTGKVTLRLGWSESPLNLNPFDRLQQLVRGLALNTTRSSPSVRTACRQGDRPRRGLVLSSDENGLEFKFRSA